MYRCCAISVQGGQRLSSDARPDSDPALSRIHCSRATAMSDEAVRFTELKVPVRFCQHPDIRIDVVDVRSLHLRSLGPWCRSRHIPRSYTESIHLSRTLMFVGF